MNILVRNTQRAFGPTNEATMKRNNHHKTQSKSLTLFWALVASTAFLLPESYASLSGRKIGLDPGHGAGVNQGVVIAEGTWTLDAAFRARTHLQNDGAAVVMTRTTGADPALSTRVNILNSNNCHRAVCLHSNAASAAASGIEAYYCSLNPSPSSSQTLATRLRTRALNMVHNNNRGTKECLNAGRGFHFYMVRYTSMPTSLPEYYFHTNPWENQNIHNTTTGRENIGKSLYAAICDVYGQTPVFGSPPPSGAGGIIVDNAGSGFNVSGSWYTSTNVSGYYGSNYHVRPTGSLSDPATWTFTVNSRGDYEVFARWTSASDRATAAPYIIHHANGSTTVNVNQQANGGQWNSLGTYRFGGSSPTSHSVQLSCWTSSGPYVIADAIRLVPKTVWVDNHHSGFSASSNWAVATWASDKYGPDYAYRDTEAISDAANWTVDHLTDGSYTVQAWWTAAANRATSAPYIVHRKGGTTVVNANQTINGGQWRTLGTFALDEGENLVQLSCWTTSGDVVIADAVRWILQ